ncbi:MAG TPA: PAS domain-containing sensor histidine kinase, partial [Aggregatilineales bacterium]|nr:PAS domain-containing sensor histidine kinase [Aggregatilineales bacterium]
ESAHQSARLQAILDKTGEGIIYTEGIRIVYVNDALCRLTEYTAADLIGKPLRLLRGTSVSTGSSPLFDTPPPGDDLLSREPVERQEIQLQRKSGRILEASLTISRVSQSDDDVLRTVILVRDISQEKQLHDMQNRFITHAAHELRHPITNIVTRLYLLRRSPEDLDRHITILENAARRLTTLAEHMSTIAEFDLGRIRLESMQIQVQELLTPLLVEQEKEALENDIMLSFDWDMSRQKVAVDTVLLTRLIRLMLANSILNSPAHSSIYVRFTSSDTPKGIFLNLHIHDNRPAIPENHLSQFFQPFYLVSEGSIIQSGLELTIVRMIVDVFGGSIDVVNDPGENGVIFDIHLPVQ